MFNSLYDIIMTIASFLSQFYYFTRDLLLYQVRIGNIQAPLVLLVFTIGVGGYVTFKIVKAIIE